MNPDVDHHLQDYQTIKLLILFASGLEFLLLLKKLCIVYQQLYSMVVLPSVPPLPVLTVGTGILLFNRAVTSSGSKGPHRPQFSPFGV